MHGLEKPLLGQPLTPAEKQVYALVASALPNKNIAAQLLITEGTIKHHVGVILKKLGLKNRVQLALRYHGIDIPNSALPLDDPLVETLGPDTSEDSQPDITLAGNFDEHLIIIDP
jgi:DNA-binding CsgD family transcriptional regulator